MKISGAGKPRGRAHPAQARGPALVVDGADQRPLRPLETGRVPARVRMRDIHDDEKENGSDQRNDVAHREASPDGASARALSRWFAKRPEPCDLTGAAL